MLKRAAILFMTILMPLSISACNFDDAGEKIGNFTVSAVKIIADHAVNTFKTASSKECAESILKDFGVTRDSINAWEDNNYKKLPKAQKDALANGLKEAAKNCLTFVN